MSETKKKPCELKVSYIKITYDKDGKVKDITVKVESRKANESGK